MSEQKDQQWAINEMANWLASPTEFGEKPIEAHVIYENEILWAKGEAKKVFLIHYKMKDGTEGVGFTGPITRSFIGIDCVNFIPEDLIYCYTGWYLLSIFSSLETYSDELSDDEKQRFTETLKTEGYDNPILKDQFTLYDEDENETKQYYVAEVIENGVSFYAVGTKDEYDLYEKDFPPMTLSPFYYYVGEKFDPFNVEA